MKIAEVCAPMLKWLREAEEESDESEDEEDDEKVATVNGEQLSHSDSLGSGASSPKKAVADENQSDDEFDIDAI